MAYPDIHQHLKNLEAAGLLRRIPRPINKDTVKTPGQPREICLQASHSDSQ